MEFILENESDATNLVTAMNKIRDQYGHVTLSDVHNLLGLSTTFMETKVGWRNIETLLSPGDDGNVVLKFLNDLEDITPLPQRNQTIRVVFEIDSTDDPKVEQFVLDAINATPLRQVSRMWSMSKRPGLPVYRPRVQYSSPIRPYGEDDI